MDEVRLLGCPLPRIRCIFHIHCSFLALQVVAWVPVPPIRRRMLELAIMHAADLPGGMDGCQRPAHLEVALQNWRAFRPQARPDVRTDAPQLCHGPFQ